MIRLLALACLPLAALGCSHTDSGSAADSRMNQAASCLKSLDVDATADVYAEDIVDGGVGTYKLIEARVFSKQMKDGITAYIGGRTTFSKFANPAHVDLDGRSSVVCADVQDIPGGEVQADTNSPLAFSRTDGKIPDALKYTVKTHYVRYGDQTTEDQKVTANYETSTAYSDDSIFKKNSYDTATRTLQRLDTDKIAMRIEQTTSTGTIILISIYQLVTP